jgi:hypothetical protein
MLEGINLLEWGYYSLLVVICVLIPVLTVYLHRYEYSRPLRGPVIVDSLGLSVYGVVLSELLVVVVWVVNTIPVGLTIGARIALLAICLVWPAILVFEAVQLGAHRIKPLRK